MTHCDAPPPIPPPLQPRERPGLLSVVLPAFNEALNLVDLLPELCRALADQAKRLELLVIDDGSNDDTAWVVRSKIQQGLPVRLLRLSRNFGKEAALCAGLDAAEGEAVLIMDSDGQHPIATALQMLAEWRRGFDMVYGVQNGRRESQSWTRRGFTRLFYWLIHHGSRINMPPNAGDFRLLDRRVVLALRTLPERARYMKGLFAWVGFTTKAIEYVPHCREHGVSSYGLVQLLSFALVGLTAFTKMPLRLVSLLGLLVSVLSVVFGVWVVLEKTLFGQPVSGFTTLAASITFLAGVQLLCLGIIAEYLGRVFDEVKQRPLYVVQDLTPPLLTGKSTRNEASV
ncbi:glycosyltransferase family 2 protein [Roseateles oligotrophus]|uniref:Glycosyltransferase family 2 protein n=1 Tax=Roseateles oligotrophus TaxID=1769250 RepID=A0ABT2YDH2_9BURK|nr:glycosyltransferase family 2 protein [Roseateles oligotrophus]MCV2368105.1 glycosyltransferase family 2 protein [Roseateles oligotrophus]